MGTLFLSMSGTSIVNLSAVGIIVILALVGTIKGFAKTFLQIFGTIFAIIISVLLCARVATLFERWFGMITFFSANLNGTVENLFGSEVTSLTLEQVVNDETLITSSNKLSILFVRIILKVAESGASPEATVGAVLSNTFGYYVSIVITAVVLFIVSKIAFWLLGKLISKLHEFKPIGILDSVLGLALGVIEGLIVVQVLTMAFGYIPISFCQEVTAYIEQSTFISLINNINVLGWIIKAFTEAKVVEFIKNTLGA